MAMTEKLTEAEREMLRHWWGKPGGSGDMLAELEATVEAILAARLAPVEALADAWGRGLAIDGAHPMEPVSRLLTDIRAVLRSDTHTEQKPAPKITDADLTAALKEYGKTPEGKAWLASLDLPPRLPELYGDAHTEPWSAPVDAIREGRVKRGLPPRRPDARTEQKGEGE